MKEPFLKDDAFLADVELARREEGKLHIWWLGQSGFLLLHQRKALLMDPYLSDSLTRKYIQTNKPHVRITARVIAPERLDFIAGVTSSHNHTDHLDAETLLPLLTTNPEMHIIVPEANREFAAARLQVSTERLIGLTIADIAEVGPFRIHPLPAAHEDLEIDSNGNYKHHSYIVQAAGWTLFHAGDCVLYDGLVENLRQWQIDIAFLPINGRDPERGVAGNFNGVEAALLAYECAVGLVIPMHFDMFEFNTTSPDQFEETCKQLRQAYRTLRNGERISFK